MDSSSKRPQGELKGLFPIRPSHPRLILPIPTAVPGNMNGATWMEMEKMTSCWQFGNMKPDAARIRSVRSRLESLLSIPFGVPLQTRLLLGILRWRS